jgi:dTDP-4-amino-4,6-dideoxy-D-glucose acyltransferase
MFYTKEELHKIGFKSLGENVLISDKASIYNPQNISIGNNVRIDDFCILSAGSEITIGNYVHIACYTSLIGRGKIILQDFVSIAARCTILSSCDDFSGLSLVNPMIDEKYLGVIHGNVMLMSHSVIGVGSVILPNVLISKGAAVGALSLVKKDIPSFQIWGGNPIKFIKERSTNLLNLEKDFLYEKLKNDYDELINIKEKNDNK